MHSVRHDLFTSLKHIFEAHTFPPDDFPSPEVAVGFADLGCSAQSKFYSVVARSWAGCSGAFLDERNVIAGLGPNQRSDSGDPESQQSAAVYGAAHRTAPDEKCRRRGLIQGLVFTTTIALFVSQSWLRTCGNTSLYQGQATQRFGSKVVVRPPSTEAECRSLQIACAGMFTA